MFSRVNGALTVVGVVSYGDPACSYYGIDTRVNAYTAWIAATLETSARPDCDIAGGGCGDDACWPLANGSGFECLPSDGRQVGQDCNPDSDTWSPALPCADGSVCLPAGQDGAGRCVPFCTSASHCAPKETCRIPVFVGIDDIGVCIADGS